MVFQKQKNKAVSLVSFCNFVSVLKFTVLFNNKKGFAEICKLNFLVLTKLLFLGFISSFKKHNTRFFVFYLNKNAGFHLFTNILSLVKPKKKLFISITKLKSFFKSDGLLLISTKKGVLTRQEALNTKTGGLLLLRIW